MNSNVEPLYHFKAHETYILKCVVSPNSKYLATSSADSTVKIWNINDNCSYNKTLQGHQV